MTAGLVSFAYGPMGVTTLIGRSWNLLKRNAKVSFTLILIPVLMFGVTSFLMTLPSSFQTLSGSPGNYMMLLVLVFGSSLILSLFAWWILLLVCCAVSRIYYLSLVREEPGSLGEVARFVGRHWLKLSGLYGVLVFLNMLFLMPYGVVMLLGFAATAFLMTQVALLNTSTMQIGGGLLLLLIGFLTVVALSLLFVVQIFLNLFPINLIASLPEEGTKAEPKDDKEVSSGLFKSISAGLDHITEELWSVVTLMGTFIGLMSRNLPRIALFGITLMGFYVFLVLFFQIPIFIWLTFEMQRLTLNPENLNSLVLPMHVHLISQLWTSLVNAVVWSFMFAGMTLFYYDCKARTEGLDLQLTLTDIQQRWFRSRSGVKKGHEGL